MEMIDSRFGSVALSPLGGITLSRGNDGLEIEPDGTPIFNGTAQSEWQAALGGGSSDNLFFAIDSTKSPFAMTQIDNMSNPFAIIPIYDDLKVGDWVTVSTGNGGLNVGAKSGQIADGLSFAFLQGAKGVSIALGSHSVAVVVVDENLLSKADVYLGVANKLSSLGGIKAFLMTNNTTNPIYSAFKGKLV